MLRDRHSKLRTVIRVTSGNFLEMYDFFVFAYYASAIGHAFFPSGSEFVSLMSSFLTFGVGFIVRPLGAIVLGAYLDQHGRRAGLLLTLALMSIGTLSMAVVPGYQTIGLFAPLLIVAGRLLQGFSAGVEVGGVSVYLSEMATPGHKGFYVAWQSGSQQVAVIFIALMGVALAAYLTPEQLDAWGWRIPFIIGCMIIPFIFVIRSTLKETEAFLQRKRHLTAPEIFRSVVTNWRIVLLGMLLVIMTTVSFYFITAFTPTFGREVLKLTGTDSLIVTLCVGVSNLFWLPVGGAISDRVGRKPILYLCTAASLLTAYPVLYWLVSDPSFVRLLLVELWLSMIYGAYNGAMVVYLTEVIPAHVRTSGFSFAYSAATVVGGFTPAVATFLIHQTGNRAVAGLWLMFAAACGMAATYILKPYKESD
ncbi:MAG TPA: MFS transporter [Stellaceae bacterium]|jgi:MHS family citrate/tricarballylate:H+ symporter-like MFS transporter|nr:MFS transporter [Stellaceae bacterium]